MYKSKRKKKKKSFAISLFCCRWFVDYSSKTIFFIHSLSFVELLLFLICVCSLVRIPCTSATHWKKLIEMNSETAKEMISSLLIVWIHTSKFIDSISVYGNHTSLNLVVFDCFFYFYIISEPRMRYVYTIIHIYTLHVRSFVYFMFNNNNSSVNCWQASPSTIGEKRQTEYSFYSTESLLLLLYRCLFDSTIWMNKEWNT